MIEQAQQGAVSAVGELYNRHHECIFRYVRSRVPDNHLAEDLTGEIFTRMLSNLPKYRPTGVPFRAWLYRIAHNLMVDHIRKRGRYDEVPLSRTEGLSEGSLDPALAVEHKLTAERVRDALYELQPLQCEVVALRFLMGFSLKETSVAVGKSVAAVKSLQRRGLAALRTVLEQE